MRDVARLANVSPTTVSRVFNGRPYVGEENRRAVLEAADRLGYHPDHVARGLRTGRTMSVGAVVPDLSNPVSANMLNSASEVLAGRSYFTLIAQQGSTQLPETTLIREFLRRRVEGLLWCVADDRDPAVTAAIRDIKSPVVLLDRCLPEVPADCVVGDHYTAVRSMTEYILSAGHRRIAIIPGTLAEWSARERLRAYNDAFRINGLAVDPGLICELDGPPTVANGELAVRSLLSRKPSPAVLIAGSNRTTIGALRTVRAAGLSPPDDIAIVSVSEPEAVEGSSAISAAMRIPAEEIGSQAAKLLLRRLSGDLQGEGRKIVLPLTRSAGPRDFRLPRPPGGR